MQLLTSVRVFLEVVRPQDLPENEANEDGRMVGGGWGRGREGARKDKRKHTAGDKQR